MNASGSHDLFCSGCGEPRIEGKDFCASCGSRFEHAGSPSSAGSNPSLSAVGPVDVALLGGAALLVVAPFLPFITATALLVGSISRNGVEITSGEALSLSAAGVIVGLIALRSLGKPKRGWLVILGYAVVLLSGYYFVQINNRVSDVGSDLALASVGAGIWVALAGSVLILVAAHVGWRPRGEPDEKQ